MKDKEYFLSESWGEAEKHLGQWPGAVYSCGLVIFAIGVDM